MRGLVRLIVIVVVVVAAGMFLLGYRWDSVRGTVAVPAGDRPAATSGIDSPIDTDRARQAGAELGERVAAGASRVRDAVAEGQLTAKIKSKIALDDTLDGHRVSVETEGAVVTLTGRVARESQRQRVLQLARETEGVSSVVDRLEPAAR